MLGVGGGRPIDVAKCASFNLKMPFVSVPTAASHDGIVSSRASIINDKGRKESLGAQPPLALVADTGQTVELLGTEVVQGLYLSTVLDRDRDTNMLLLVACEGQLA